MATYIDQLLQDPSFLTGVSLLGGRTNQIGSNILGAQQAIQGMQAARQMQAVREAQMQQQQAQQNFDVSKYIRPDNTVDRAGLLSGAIPIFGAQGASQLENALSARKNLVPVPAGSSLYDYESGHNVFTAPQKEANANPTVVGLNQLLDKRDSFKEGSANWKIYDNMIQHVTGSDKAGMKAPSGYFSTGQTDESGAPILAPIPGGPADVGAQNKEQVRQDKLAQQQQQVDTSRQRFSSQLERTNIPQMDSAIYDAENIINQYPKGSAIPGFGIRDSLLPDAMLSEEGKRNRQAVNRLQNMQIKTISGASTSNQEILRNQKQMGTTTFMTPDALRRGIEGLRSGLTEAKKNAAAGVTSDVYKAYLDAGGIDLGRDLGQPESQPANAPTPTGINKSAPSQNDALQELKRRGLIK